MHVRNILEVRNLQKVFGKGSEAVHAVNDVSFSIREGSTLGILGESGSGKSTLGRCVLRLIEPDSGSIRYKGEELTYLPNEDMRCKRREMQMIFQNPYSSLNPKMTVGENVMDPLHIWNLGEKLERPKRVRELLDLVGLSSRSLDAYPYEFSGGQQQRINIARALALKPKLIICDEATSALDVSVQAQIINLLMDLQKEFKLTYIFISHNLGVVEYLSDEVLVMHNGMMKELSTTEEIYKFPKNEYTKSLIESVPKMPSPEELMARKEARKKLF
jgi:peptide/nickel transport system ATP-binding protein